MKLQYGTNTEINLVNAVKEEKTPQIQLPTYDPELNSYNIEVIMPVLDPADQFIGAMDISYSLDNLLTFEQSVESGLVMGINLSDQTFIVSRNGEISTFQIPLGVGFNLQLQELGM